MQIKKSIYLMKELKAFPLTLYHMRLSLVMIAIRHGSIAKLKISSRKKIRSSKKCYLQNKSDVQLFRRFQRLLLTVTIEKLS